ncbi:MAG: invasion protein CiaB, partial [Campylobacter sp.]
MNDFKRLNELVAAGKDELNAMYRQLDNPSEIVLKMLKIAGFKGEKSEKVAVLRRIVDLKTEPLENELKKQGREETEIGRIKDEAFELVREFYEARFEKLLVRVKEEKILDDFYLALLSGMHGAGLAMNAWQSAWDRQILQTTNKEFEAKFASMAEAIKFIDENRLYQKDGDEKGERSYGAVIKNGEKYAFAPYAAAFEKEVKRVADALDALIKNLKSLAASDEQRAYVRYFEKLKAAFCERENDCAIPAWQDAERAWMDVKGPLQPGHPLEYYEDAYTHAVALEWDVRLAGASDFDEEKFKASVIRAYEQICEQCGIKDAALARQVTQNIARTQTYISVPMIYYGAELNGLFSAQVVPNDETVSKERGKKIFAFVEHVYESAKARPFMKLSG